MKRVPYLRAIIALAFIMCIFFVGHPRASAQEASAPSARRQPTVLILGSYHMGNPGRDVLNVQADDVLAPKRQQEIVEVIALLKKFRPTRIAIEETADNPKYGDRYRQYLSGSYQLTRDEIDQLAFRLAKESGISKLYPIDWKGEFDFDKVKNFADANGQSAIIEEGMTFGRAYVAKLNGMMKTSTVRELLRWINSAQRVNDGQQFYLRLTRVGKGPEYVGADLVADWYERNLKIFANLTRITESPDDRILVLIGAGHVKLLQQFVEDSGEYVLERADKYL